MRNIELYKYSSNEIHLDIADEIASLVFIREFDEQLKNYKLFLQIDIPDYGYARFEINELNKAIELAKTHFINEKPI